MKDGVDNRGPIDSDEEPLPPPHLRKAPPAAPPPDDEPAVERPQLNYTPAEQVLGALLASGSLGPDASASTLAHVRGEGLAAAMFEREREQAVYAAIERVVDRGEPAAYNLVEEQLRKDRTLTKAGGAMYVRELAKMVPALGNAPHWARLVFQEADRRDLERLGLRLTEAARNGGISDELRQTLLQAAEAPTQGAPPPEAVDGGTFVFDEPTDPAAIRIWGADTAIGWSAGEGLMLAGPDGVGKTTLGQQLALARCGLRAQVLGMNVIPDTRRVLYIAADRPRQAARSLRRMVSETDRAELAERMTVWRGPLPAMLNEDRTILARLAKQFDAGTVIVDSLKDVAVDLATDEAGGRIATAFQHLIAGGVELLVLHHPRKPGVDNNRKPRDLSDFYGSRLIYGVMGSAVMLWGDPGDVIVELRHLKQPIDEIGPWNIRHDHTHGSSSIEKQTDLLEIVLRAGTQGLTAITAAGLIYEKEVPSRNDIERTRAKLDRLAGTDRLVKFPGAKTNDAPRYVFNGPAEALQ